MYFLFFKFNKKAYAYLKISNFVKQLGKLTYIIVVMWYINIDLVHSVKIMQFCY